MYGKWLPLGNKAAVDRLDEGSGSKTVAKAKTGTPDVSEVPVSFGGPSRTRTLDPLIKSETQGRRTGTYGDASAQDSEGW